MARKICKMETAKFDDQANEASNNPIVTITIPDIKGPSLAGVKILRGQSKEGYQLLIARMSDGTLQAMGGLCPYDGKTQLSNGLLTKDKLICPEHGCEFCVNNGWVEYGPAMDNLPKFLIKEHQVDTDEKLTLKVEMPLHPPVRIEPFVVGRIPQDFRQVAVIGNGTAGMGVVETLRRMFYTGAIMVFGQNYEHPVFKWALSRHTELKGHEREILIKSPNFLKKVDVEIQSNEGVKNVKFEDDFGSIATEEGSKFMFDAAVISVGSSSSSIPSCNEFGKNFIMLDNLSQFKKAEKLLSSAKKVAVSGISLDSIQLISTLLRDKPNLEVHLFGKGKLKSPLAEVVGKKSERELLKALQQKGVKLHTKHLFQKYKLSNLVEEVSGIFYGDPKAEIKEFKADMYYHFEQERPDLGFINFEEERDELPRNIKGQLDVNTQQRTQKKLLFAAGSCSATGDCNSRSPITYGGPGNSLYQGSIAALGLLGHMFPHNRPQYSSYGLMGKTFHQLGATFSDSQELIAGSTKELSFLRVGFQDGIIVSAFGSQEYAKEILLMREGMNKNLVLQQKQLVEDPNLFFKRLADKIEEIPGPSCFRQFIFDKKDNVINRNILWHERDNKEELFGMNFSNFKQEGV